MRNVIVIGSGPAGYSAAIYLSRARLEPLLFSGTEIGGQLMYTTEVENFPGFPEGVQGPELMVNMREQAKRFGTEIIDKSVARVEKTEQGFAVTVGEGAAAEVHEAKAVLVTTGAKSRMLGLPNEDEVLGRGLSTCAVCDAAFFRDQVVYVVGGGDSAMEDALALTKFASEVHLVHRRDSFRASQIMQERVLNHDKVTVHWNTQVTEIQTNEHGMVAGLTLENLETKTTESVAAGGVFYAIGHIPTTDFVQDLVALNDEKYIVTALGLDQSSIDLAGERLENGRLRYLTQTTTEGIFAAGDCVDFRYRQAATAAGMGVMGALDVERWLENVAE
ncbi:thioredoxin-disulfide reductase [Candidatus Woesebacteria bacterium]|nr:thioredoxin-disulfide reductase [Candidatus Woesebacteria bacterium]MCD8527198.1 thioredoxin-disulfide reductase [Candidatus Woesebacteria bacterium]MCD8546563.1 thioredoxin-disulfide reductase [Candidatus Woesebacteria bacterium]